jgi:hypothetical protein
MPRIERVDRIMLRSYWFSRRKPSIRIGLEVIELHLPLYFGKAVWRIPKDQAGVIDLPRHDATVETVTDVGGVVFASPLPIPYFVTTGPLAKPNLMLLFRTKQRLPPFRKFPDNKGHAIPFTAKMTRSVEGTWVSGLTLRALDSTNAQQIMAAAGVVTVPSMLEWLKEHYETINDPAEKVEHFQRRARAERISTIMQLLFFLLFAAMWLSVYLHKPHLALGLTIPWLLLLFGNRHIQRLLSRKRSR